MKSAYFTFKESYRTIRGKVTLNDDGKITVNLHDGRMASANLRYRAKMYAEKIAKENFIDPTITNIEEVTIDSQLIQILYKETVSLKIQYVEKCKNYAIQEFERALVLTKLNAPDLYTHFNIPFTFVNEKMILPTDLHTTYRSELKTMSKALTEARSIVYQTESRYVDKAIKSAEKHYEKSIIKLALRIDSKGLDITKLETETSHIDVNINTILTDGNITVKAWTIIAEGPIQKPHYRYLVK